jgi:Acetyltransferases, including N-acetylases of ribosomal proteins
MLHLQTSELPVINGEKLSLRPITDADTEDIVRWRNDPEVWKYFLFREPFTPELHRAWLKNKVETGMVIQYMIVECESGHSVGSVYFRDVDEKNESAEYGIFIGEPWARRRGLGTETAKLFTRFGLEVLRLHRISLKVLGGNAVAMRSYEKAGFRTEGVFRDYVKLDGEFTDVVFMARLAGEGGE